MEFVGGAMLLGALVGAGVNGANEQSNEDDLKKKIAQVHAQTQAYKNKIAQMQQKGSYDFQTYLQETIEAGTQLNDMQQSINLATVKYANQQKTTLVTGIVMIALVTIVLVVKLLFPKFSTIKNALKFHRRASGGNTHTSVASQEPLLKQ